jgi:hypothetical protein
MMAIVTDDPFAAAATSAARLTDQTGPHDVAVVLGSGWTPAADAIGTTEAEIPLAELGGFPGPTVPGHSPAVRSSSRGRYGSWCSSAGCICTRGFRRPPSCTGCARRYRRAAGPWC